MRKTLHKALAPLASTLGLAAVAAFGSAPGRPAAPRMVQSSPAGASQAAKLSSTDGAAFFLNEVKPILVSSCLNCHSGASPQGGLKLSSREALLKGGMSGTAVHLNKPDTSKLLAAVNYKGPQMPPGGKLPKKQIDVLAKWVAMGLPWAEGESASLEPKPGHAGPPKVDAEAMKFWSFQPVRRPAVPVFKNDPWVRNPVDAFVLKELRSAGLTPNPPASRATLIRRATYDLIGLPPTPEEVRAFVTDDRPDAYERLVDRLLASPQYGEKWGRHWLDLVRFAETNSYERDGNKPNAWRYRDYVIKSFNDDKPYDQFVREQLAGDELPERTKEGLIATGYYRLGLWDDEPADREQALYDDLDDIASTTGQVFLGLTIGCARCHDHKIDPIPQKDYYRFLAFFAGVTRFGERSFESIYEATQLPLGTDEEKAKQAEAIKAHQKRIGDNRQQIEAIEKRIESDLTPVEKEEFKSEQRRAPILKLRVPALLSQADYDRYLSLREEARRLSRFQPPALDMALAVTERDPREMHVLMRGNPHVPGEQVEPGFPSVLNPPAPEIVKPNGTHTAGRRAALAKWIASKENPLTARVMANRVWQYHFGRGLARTTSNFGYQGLKPTHPELLDWLAAELMEPTADAHAETQRRKEGQGQITTVTQRHRAVYASLTETRRKEGQDAKLDGDSANPKSKIQNPKSPAPWTLKRLHRLIMLSSAYRMSSAPNEKSYAKDPDNDHFWRFDMRRLEAEEVRDSILAANGSLNPKMGGPSMFPTIPPEVLAGQSMPGAGWGRSSDEEQRRRSVYIFVKRSLITPIIASFDGPETDFTCPARFSTTQPTQALGMLNSTFVNDEAKNFAAYLRKQAGEKPEDQVKLALWRTMQREPNAKEIARGVKFMETAKAGGAADPLASFCVIALNLNEFLYLD